MFCQDVDICYSFNIPEQPDVGRHLSLKFWIFFSSPKCPDWLWGPASVLFNGYWGSFSWVKWPGHDVGLSPPSRTKEKSEWSCTSVVRVCIHNVD